MKYKKLFEQIEKTVEYQETYYWNTRWKLDIKHNKFWCQYAMYLLNNDNDNNKFLSEWFAFAQSSINEILLAMSIIDLPLDNDKQIWDKKISYIYNDKKKSISMNHNVKINALSPTILFIKQLKQKTVQIAETNVAETDGKSKSKTKSKSKSNQVKSILVHTNYFDPKEKYIFNENDDKIEKFIDPLNIRPLKVYGMSIVITVISSVTQKINILTQIPTGSIPLNNGYQTKIDFIIMNPYTVKKIEIYFYFPSIGTYQQYPVIIYKSNSDIISSSSPSQEFNHKVIVKQKDKTKSKITNIESWNQVSLYGDNHQIYQYLISHNLHTIDLSRIYYKLKKSKQFYHDILKLCMDQNYVDDKILSFQFYWIKKEIDNLSKIDLKQRVKIMREYLVMSHITKYNQANDIRLINNHNALPTASRFRKESSYIYLEYMPLINARAHLLGQQRKLLNV